jgi:hypothetical protein
MDLQEATVTMALLMKKESDFYEQHAIPDISLTRENLKELEWLKANTREFGNRLAANPYFFDVMESWVVTVLGTEGVNTDSMKEAMGSADVDDLIDRASALAASIKKHLRDNGYVICNMGAGEDGWDIGIRCSEKKSRDLCVEIHQRYMQAIEMGLLTISRRFAGHSLPGLYSYDDAKRILLIYGDSSPSSE